VSQALGPNDEVIEQLGAADDEDRLAILADACRAQLHQAEGVLDDSADAAGPEATRFADDPEPLLALVHHVRQLSRR
jgi:hypothetical protein